MDEKQQIYGSYLPAMKAVMGHVEEMLTRYDRSVQAEEGERAFEHIDCRIKSDESMRGKCRRKNLPETPESALGVLTDAIGIRVVCSFRDDVYQAAEAVRQFPDCRVVTEKDYIKKAKPNGYRSYHMILSVAAPFADVTGKNPGSFFVEIQIRTIAMDTWAALEHKMRYKKNIPVETQALLGGELKRCADELASCDLSMQTIRDLIGKEERDKR